MTFSLHTDPDEQISPEGLAFSLIPNHYTKMTVAPTASDNMERIR